MDARQAPWHDLQVFLETARAGSLAAAAKDLNISSATVHRRLAQLERSLACVLFLRSPRGYALTEAGQDLYRHVLVIEQEVDAAQRRLEGRDQRLQGLVRLATVDDLAVTMLGPILADFSQRHPGVELELIVSSDHADLARRDADVALRTGAQPDEANLIARRVCGVGVAMYGSSSAMADAPRGLTANAWRGQRLIRGDAARAGLPMEQWLDRHAPDALVAMRSGSMLARMMAVRDGMGVGLLPCFAADAEPGLCRLGQVLPEASATLWLLTHADLRRSARVRAFVQHMHSALTQRAPRLEGLEPPPLTPTQAVDSRQRAASMGK